MSNFKDYLETVNKKTLQKTDKKIEKEISKFVLKFIKKAWFPEALETNLEMFGSEFDKNFYKDNMKKIDSEYLKEFNKQKKTNRNIKNAIKRGF